MFIGAHSIIYSTNPSADRAFLGDVLAFPSVDIGGGWLIFGLPPAEVAVHPSSKNDVHELYLMCDDVGALVAQMKTHNIACSPVESQDWGLVTRVSLPGGGRLGIYQPRHVRPPGTSLSKAPKKGVKRAPKERPRRRMPTNKARRR